MFRNRIGTWSRGALLCGALFAVSVTTGCQTNITGQTLPSAYFLRDDVQYFPAGPEDQLSNLREALEQYKLEQSVIREGLQEPAP